MAVVTASPLQVFIFRDKADVDLAAHEEAVLRAFEGGCETGDYLACGEDLGVPVRVFHGAPAAAFSPADALDAACHTLVVILIGPRMLEKGSQFLWNWLAECWSRIDASKERHRMLVFALDERCRKEFGEKETTLKGTTLEDIQVASLPDLGEHAMLPAALGLQALHFSRLLLVPALSLTPPSGHQPGFLRLFISHAKMDGLPLAHALKRQIAALKLRSFYDAQDLPAGCNWKRELERGVGSSLLVVLRTEKYDSRYWCRQEVLWADEFVTPAILVDARTGLNHPPDILPLNRMPRVRIPDGNLIRILNQALREGTRVLLFMRKVKWMEDHGIFQSGDQIYPFSYAPSMTALLRACETSVASASISSVKGRLIMIYPDPPLASGLYQAAQALIKNLVPAAELVTPDTLASTPGLTKGVTP